MRRRADVDVALSARPRGAATYQPRAPSFGVALFTRPEVPTDDSRDHRLRAPAALADGGPAPDYATRVAPIFKKYCAGCHNDEDREGKFSLESYASLQRGTAHGPALLPGDAKGSRIVRLLTGAAKPMMPPKDEPRPGRRRDRADRRPGSNRAHADRRGRSPTAWRCLVPKIPAHAKVRPVVAMDATHDGRWLAVARGAEVGLYSRARAPRRSAGSHAGKLPRQGDCLAFHPRRRSAWSRPRASRAWAASRRSGTSPTERWSGVSRATATFSTTRSSLPTANGSPPAAMTRRSSSGTRSPASRCARWKGTPGRSTMWRSAPTAASS